MRKSPPQSATKYKIGTIKIGNDGNKWIIIEDINGRNRWKLYKSHRKSRKSLKSRGKSKRKSRGKSKRKSRKKDVYFTHDNGGRPFIVEIKGNIANVAHNTENGPKLIKQFTILNKWIGKSSGKTKMNDHTPKQSKMFDGNTILLQLAKNEFVFIGDSVYKFSLSGGDENHNLKYYSPVGHSDVPYPFLVGEKNVYFFGLGDRKYIPKTEFKNFKNPLDWEEFAYDIMFEAANKKSKIPNYNLKNLKVIASRNPWWKK